MRPLTATAMAIPVTADLTGIVSLRSAGDMRRPAELRRWLAQIGVTPDRVCRVAQIHSRRVVPESECRRLLPSGRRARQTFAQRWAARTADGLLAGAAGAAAGRALLVTAADCVPILMAAPNGAYALLHSGWRGTGIAATAVRVLRERHGVDPAALTVLLGPAIGACCYRVDEERHRLFRDTYGNDAVRTGAPAPRSEPARYLNLHAANAVLLRRLGVLDIRAVAACTSCTPLLHSSRRDGGGLHCRLMAVLLVPCAAAARRPVNESTPMPRIDLAIFNISSAG